MNQGSVTHNGNRYDLGRLFEIVKTRPVGSVSVVSLSWIIGTLTNPCGSCKHGPESWHEERIEGADVDCPVLVIRENAVHYVIDGLHRLIKANREAVARLPCRWVFPSDMERALISGFGHFDFQYDGMDGCKVCGLVKPHDGWKKPCRGPSEITLRGAAMGDDLQCIKCKARLEPPTEGRSAVECQCGAIYGLDFFRGTPIPSTGDPILDEIFS